MNRIEQGSQQRQLALAVVSFAFMGLAACGGSVSANTISEESAPTPDCRAVPHDDFISSDADGLFPLPVKNKSDALKVPLYELDMEFNERFGVPGCTFYFMKEDPKDEAIYTFSIHIRRE